MTRHSTNRNLTIHHEPKFNDWDVLTNYQLSQEYLSKIQSVLNKSLQQHPRTFLVRFDLHLPKILACPDFPSDFNTEAITRFIESLKSQLRAQQERSLRAGKRVHPNTLRYIWAKEQHDSAVPHYHVALLFNNDAYYTLPEASERYSIFWICSRICSINTFNSTAAAVMSVLIDFEPRVFASRLNSCIIKSKRRP